MSRQHALTETGIEAAQTQSLGRCGRYDDNDLASPVERRVASLVVLFQAKLAIILLDNSIAFAGGVFKLLTIHDLNCAAGVLDELLLLQNTSCLAHARSIGS